MDRKKKIIFTVTNDLSYDQRMQRICSSLAKHGYDVELVGRLRKKSIALDTLSFKQTRIYCAFEKGILFYLEYNIRLFFFILKNNADIISSVDVDTLLPCLLATKIKSKPIVFDAHEYYTESPEIVNRPAIKRIWSGISNVCIPKVKVAYTVGPMLAKIMSEKYKIPFGCVRNVPFTITTTNQPINQPPNQQIEKSANQKIILYQGALNKGRGIEESIVAMQQVNAELWLAGDGDLMDELKQLVIEKNIQEKVKFLGYVKPTELKQITQQAYLGLNLLQPIGLSYYYSLANKFFDYMQYGIPCITADFPEYEAINKKYNCTYLCSCNAEQIAMAINSLLNDSNLYQTLQQNCLLAKKDLCWEQEENTLVDLYNSI